jgi:hypothetical protein
MCVDFTTGNLALQQRKNALVTVYLHVLLAFRPVPACSSRSHNYIRSFDIISYREISYGLAGHSFFYSSASKL